MLRVTLFSPAPGEAPFQRRLALTYLFGNELRELNWPNLVRAFVEETGASRTAGNHGREF